MNKVTEKILRIISRGPRGSYDNPAPPFDYVESRKGILRELMIGRESGKLIGLISPVLGDGLFLASVTSIESHGVFVFRKYDIRHGRLLTARIFCVDDIQAVFLIRLI